MAALADQKNGTAHAHEMWPGFEQAFETLQSMQEKVRSVRLVLIKAKAPEAPGRETLLEKEAACCNLATD